MEQATEQEQQARAEELADGVEGANGSGPERSPAERRGLNEMFRYSMWVHVGPGAEECEDAENGKCGNPHHFHAWCRLPNQFQAGSIRDKALAAKARKVRRLRDPESDASAILDSEMEELRLLGDANELVEELVGKNYWRDQLAAVEKVNDEDDYKTIREDRERYRALEAMDEETRPQEEFEELQRHIASYFEEVDKARAAEQEPQKVALGQKSVEELVTMIREERIAAEATEDFIREFSLWQTYIGTLKPVDEGTPQERSFKSIDHLRGAAPEVVGLLEATFREMEVAIGGRGAVGN